MLVFWFLKLRQFQMTTESKAKTLTPHGVGFTYIQLSGSRRPQERMSSFVHVFFYIYTPPFSDKLIKL